MANTSTITELLEKRAQIKKKKPRFLRTDSAKIKRLARQKKWRRPKGRDNKIRRRKRGSLASPSYSSPKKVKGMHPRGLTEILASNPDELENADSTKHIIRIRSSVGNKKKRIIIKKAKELKLLIINPKIKLKIKPKEEEKQKKKEKETAKKEPEETKEKPEQEPAKGKKPEQAKEKPVKEKEPFPAKKTPKKDKKEKPKPSKKTPKKPKPAPKQEKGRVGAQGGKPQSSRGNVNILHASPKKTNHTPKPGAKKTKTAKTTKK